MYSLKDVENDLKRDSFNPSKILGNKHIQNLFSLFFPSNKIEIKSKKRIFRMRDGNKIVADCSWQSDKEFSKTLIVVHGLGGSSKSNYAIRISYLAFKKGYNIIRVNLRSCGGTERFSKNIYHAGQSSDIYDVIKELIKKDKLRDIFIAGFSLGGNVVLKFAGELRENYPKALSGVCCISSLVDLVSSAKLLEKNKVYQYFVTNLAKKIIKKKAVFDKDYDVSLLKGIKTLREFDSIYQTKHNNFRSVDEYYIRESALRFLKFVKIPTLIIHSYDDPIVPVYPLIKVSNPHIIRLFTKKGGHIGFIDKNGYWAEKKCLNFFDLIYRNKS